MLYAALVGPVLLLQAPRFYPFQLKAVLGKSWGKGRHFTQISSKHFWVKKCGIPYLSNNGQTHLRLYRNHFLTAYHDHGCLGSPVVRDQRFLDQSWVHEVAVNGIYFHAQQGPDYLPQLPTATDHLVENAIRYRLGGE